MILCRMGISLRRVRLPCIVHGQASPFDQLFQEFFFGKDSVFCRYGIDNK